MISDDQKQILSNAIKKYGVEKQVEMMIEECSELILAIQKWKRDPAKINNLHEEIADVEIMITQMREIFDSSEIDDWAKSKIERLSIRLNK